MLLIGVFSHLSTVIFSLFWPELNRALPATYNSLLLIAMSIQISGPVLYLIWRSRESGSLFGLVRIRPLIDLFAGIGIWFITYLSWEMSWSLIRSFPSARDLYSLDVDLGSLFITPKGFNEYLLWFLASCANGFTEELVMRAYLIPRFERLFSSTWKSLILSTILFASYHAYQGTTGVFYALIFGLVCGGVFCWLRRLWPVAIAHAIADFVVW